MSKADEIFKELGYIKIVCNGLSELYQYKNDYFDFCIIFDKKLKRFHYRCSAFVFSDRDTWEDMKANNQFRNDFDKHCSRYGYWGEFPEYIDMKLLQAINAKVKELGWL